MSEQDHDQPEKPKRPSHIAYQVSDGQDGKSYFNRIGAAFEHRDGEGLNIVLDATPVDGRITLRTPQERIDEMRNEEQAAPRSPRRDQDRGQ